MTKLSVNLNKFALLRNARGTNFPDVLEMARKCIAAGAHGITVHPRPDERHTKRSDVRELAAMLKEYPDVEFNIEGNPEPEFLRLVGEAQPAQCTLVPDDPHQLTSDHGWNIQQQGDRLKPIIAELRSFGCRVSLFMETDLSQIQLAKETGADRIELYTGPYAHASLKEKAETVLPPYARAAAKAQKIGLGVNAGHDLNLKNLGLFLRSVPGVLEVSIGHAIVVESLDFGLQPTIKKYLDILDEASKIAKKPI
ncbi:pyridoxine 5'-phosphate synthase [bacterium]|nr:pyridoxine 5'-phosphate synthase [bacterium]